MPFQRKKDFDVMAVFFMIYRRWMNRISQIRIIDAIKSTIHRRVAIFTQQRKYAK